MELETSEVILSGAASTEANVDGLPLTACLCGFPGLPRSWHHPHGMHDCLGVVALLVVVFVALVRLKIL